MIDAKYIKTDYRSCSIREAMYKFVGKAIFFFIDKRKKKASWNSKSLVTEHAHAKGGKKTTSGRALRLGRRAGQPV